MCTIFTIIAAISLVTAIMTGGVMLAVAGIEALCNSLNYKNKTIENICDLFFNFSKPVLLFSGSLIFIFGMLALILYYV